jgi:hypothetical protein
MVIELKSIMKSNNLINEAEMFCTDLEFRTDDQGHIREYIGDLAKKQDDVVKNIQECMASLISLFKSKLRKMAKEGESSLSEEQKMRSLALCVYVATYFRLDVHGVTNEDSLSLYT